MQTLGTHTSLNDAFSSLVAPNASVDAAGLYVMDKDAGYGAPVVSINKDANDSNTHAYVENFHRTCLLPERSAAVRYGLKNTANSQAESLHFTSHRLNHAIIASGAMVVQYVTKGSTSPDIDQTSEAFKTLKNIAANITDYRHTQRLDWADVFGLRPDRTKYEIIFIDINGYSNFSLKERRKLETAVIRAASDYEAATNLEAFQVIGDEVRFRKVANSTPMSESEIIEIVDDFAARLCTHANVDNVTVRAASTRGFISDIFVGDPNNLLAQKAFNGSALTKLGNAIKTMDRSQKFKICS